MNTFRATGEGQRFQTRLRTRVERPLLRAVVLISGLILVPAGHAMAQTPEPGDAVSVVLEPDTAGCQADAVKAVQRRLQGAGFKEVRVEPMADRGHVNAAFVLPTGTPWESVTPLLTGPAQLAFHKAADLNETIPALREIREFESRLKPYLLMPESGSHCFHIPAEHVEHVDKVLNEINSARQSEGKVFVRTARPVPGEPAVYGFYLIEKDPSLTIDKVASAAAMASTQESGRWDVFVKLDAKESEQLGELTEQSIGKPLTIFYNGRLCAVPVVQSRVTHNIQIAGCFSEEEAAAIAADLRAGSMPCPLKIVAVKKTDQATQREN